MPYNISEFRSQMTGDGARPNLFDVTLVFPTLLGETSASRRLTFQCKSASLPGRSFGVAPLFYFGREIKLAGNPTFADWSITVINDEDFLIRNAFERWMDGMNTHVTNIRTLGNNPNFYQSDAQVVQYGKAGNGLKGYNLVGCFPVDLAPIDLDWSSNDTVEEFTVTLAYQWWEGSAPGGIPTTDAEGGPIVLP
jgi:hypothetical protein